MINNLLTEQSKTNAEFDIFINEENKSYKGYKLAHAHFYPPSHSSDAVSCAMTLRVINAIARYERVGLRRI